MKIIDLTKELSPEIDIYPGDPEIRFTRLRTFPDDGCNLTLLNFGSHTGTHIDSLKHFTVDGTSCEALELERFVGESYVIHLTPENGLICDERIFAAASGMKDEKILVIDTGSSGYENIPVFETTLPEKLKKRGIITLGLSSPSLEPSYEMHTKLLGLGITIIEGLVNLDKLDGRTFISAAPLPIKGCDGSPVRAYAIV